MIGIITFHCQYNCGSALQTYALQEKITELGYECKILNYFYWHDMKNYNIRWGGKPKVILFDLYTLRNNLVRKKNYRIFQNKYLMMTQQTDKWEQLAEISRDCNTLICGSDQIWNMGTTRGIHPAYFLQFASDDQRCIAYAPSISLPKIPDVYHNDIKEALKKFSAVSVRESRTAEQLEKIIDRKVCCVLDPTLLHNTEFYDQLLGNYFLSVPKKYVFVYCLHYASLKTLRRTAEEYARSHGAKIVYFNKFNIYHKLYKNNIFKFGPKAFIYAIKHADFIIGDSFHAAVFSVLYRKQFSILALEGGQSRTDTLFEKLGIEKNYLNCGKKYSPIDYDKVFIKLDGEKRQSLAFLKRALEGKDIDYKYKNFD